MKPYTIAVDLHSLETNQGTDVIASCITEALDKYEAMRGPSYPQGDGTAHVFVRDHDWEVSQCVIVSKPQYKSREGELI